MFNSEQLQEKWQPVLNHPDLPEISDSYKRAVTSVILENQERELKETRSMLSEADMSTGAAANFDPVLISLVRRAMPNLMAYDVCGVQPMSGPTGLIFAMKARYGGGSTSNTEALFDGAQTSGSGHGGIAVHDGTNPGVLNDGGTAPSEVQGDIGSGTDDGVYNVRPGMTLAQAEAISGGSSANSGLGGSVANSTAAAGTFQDMGFTIEKTQVTARTRALRAGYTMELAQDLKAIHGLDAESELSNILSTEILAEINREVVRSIYTVAKPGAQGLTNGGRFDLDTDSNGRWSVEKFKGLLFQIERDCNAIGIETRRGKGNILMCSADVASALSMAGVLDYSPSMSTNLNVDTTGNTFAGTINGRIKVYVDPYESLADGSGNWYVAGYRGSSAYDAGLFYCPYVPLQMVRAIGENDFQPKIAFKTRYGMAENPFARASIPTNIDVNALAPSANVYYRRVRVNNIM